MVIDFNNIDTSKATKLLDFLHTNYASSEYSLEVRNFKAGKELSNDAFRELIDLRCNGKKLSLINIDFSECKNRARLFRNLHINELELTNVSFCDNADLSEYFYRSSVDRHNLNELDLSKVANISLMFDAAVISNLDISNWNTESLVKASCSFSNYHADTMDFSRWNTSKLEDTTSMFKDCRVTALILDWENIGSLVEMSKMFAYASIGYLSLRNMDMSKLSSKAVFMGSNIKTLDIRGATLPDKDILMRKYWFNGATIESIVVSKPDDIDTELFTMMHNKPNIIA